MFRNLDQTPNVPRGNKQLEDALSTATTNDELRQTLINTLISQGQVVHLRDSEYNNHLIMGQPSEPQPAVVMSANRPPDTCIRVVYPGGNTRCEIYGTSEEALDAQETKLRAMFGGTR